MAEPARGNAPGPVPWRRESLRAWRRRCAAFEAARAEAAAARAAEDAAQVRRRHLQVVR